ncbi:MULTISPECIES: HAD-IIA family hydrolase [Auritidibacter]|uniref:HAD-IIA family hydrolase n=1 Tax=Auritidibacter TaxID=1160973 RepID=UPI000D739396|nr:MULTISPECIES: HAD-IIA family hydrolase [Auritidibacter]NIH72372.1 HAD superfamily hydrolase (TIGR01450 family) [Auritidibacter ignavus]PXA81340.1 haloacid dehalogenase [Auritidibacter sp. NML120636]RMX23581.1 HAD-IIA family hydrolase [Auritidibacter ignavus]WGH82386.1 HAD-IIA family hydrolase [Auritidibacter ignavus]WHS27693.1 HAD-IIA family hydrolase [Auritidibacter ignavus]
MKLRDGHDGLLCDLDGVVYAGDQLISGAEILNDLIDHGVAVGFVTNNASKSTEAVAAKLQKLGVHAAPAHVYSSAQAGVEILRAEQQPGATVLVVGSDSLRQAVEQAGFQMVDHASQQPEAVIQGFDPGIGWKNLAEASFAIHRGAFWVATNLDLTIPQEQGIAPGNGSLIGAVTQAVGRGPDVVAGKPEPQLFQLAAQAQGMNRPLMVGDRLDTDIKGAHAAGFTAALVTTGIHQPADVAGRDRTEQPDVIIDHLGQLVEGAHE